MNFYKKCKEKSKKEDVMSVSESEDSVNDINSHAKKVELVKKCQEILPDEIPDGVESVKSDDLKNYEKFVDENNLNNVSAFFENLYDIL